MWDGRLANLEEQALGPIQSPGEMNMPIEQLMERLDIDCGIQAAVCRGLPGRGHEGRRRLRPAIATYERTVVSERAPFDAWIEGNEKAISEEAKRGFAVFNTKAHVLVVSRGLEFHQ